MPNTYEVANTLIGGACPIPERVPDDAAICWNSLKKNNLRRLYCPLSAWAISLDLCPDWEGAGSIFPSEVRCQFIGNNPIEFTFLEICGRKDFPWYTNYIICYPCRIPKQVLSILEKRALPEYLASRTPIYIMGFTSQKSSTFRSA